MSEEELVEMQCAWAEYRSSYAPHVNEMLVAHKAFTSGWLAAKGLVREDIMR